MVERCFTTRGGLSVCPHFPFSCKQLYDISSIREKTTTYVADPAMKKKLLPNADWTKAVILCISPLSGSFVA